MKVFLVAGEPSGDALGGAVMAGLRALADGPVEFLGVGGPKMAAEGLQSLFPYEELALMGLLEIVPKYRHLKRRIAETAAAAVAAAPDVLLTIDSPDFCLRVAAAVRAARGRQRTVHYVAPTVWAWRPGRAAKMAPIIDHVLALFPFEPPYMEAAGMTCDFVGHPVVAAPRAPPAEAAAFRAALGAAADDTLLLCLPGSRQSEIDRLLPRFGAAIADLAATGRAPNVVLPTLPSLRTRVSSLVSGWARPPLIIDGAEEKRAAFAAADLALAASGTVSLDLAHNRVPMVIGHDFNWLTVKLMQRAALIDTVTLVNIITDTRVVPEFLGPDCRPAPIAAALRRLIADPAARAEQRRVADLTMARLGEGGEAPGLRAARSVLAHIG